MMAKVMNGEVKPGDAIAYATRVGSIMDMKIARVLEVVSVKRAYYEPEGPALRVRVIQVSNGTRYNRKTGKWYTEPYTTTVHELSRVAKL